MRFPFGNLIFEHGGEQLILTHILKKAYNIDTILALTWFGQLLIPIRLLASKNLINPIRKKSDSIENHDIQQTKNCRYDHVHSWHAISVQQDQFHYNGGL